MLISQEVIKIIVDDWIKTEKALAKACRGKFVEIPCYADAFMGSGFGYVVNTYNCTVREMQERSIWICRVLGEEKWIIFTQTRNLIKPVIEIWDDRINIRLDDKNLNGWEYLRIEALYDKLKPYVLYDIPESDMEERNLQALVLGKCITDWLDKNRPIFKHPLEMASSLKDWLIEYETDDAHISWSNIPNFRIDIMDDMLTYHHLYGRYILHDMPEKDNKPYWVISDKPIPEYPITYFNQEKRDQMFIYIFRQHVEYILPENEQWFTGYTKNLVESIREVMKGSTILDWIYIMRNIYRQKALQYKQAEETLTTKRSKLVRISKESETDKEKKRMNKLISQKELISIFQKWIEPFIPEDEDKCCFGIVDGKFYWILDGNTITAQRCTEDNGTTYWRIYQSVYFDKPCLEIFPDHIRLHNDSGYFGSFSVDSIRDLSRMIEKNCSENKEAIYFDQIKKEEPNMKSVSPEKCIINDNATIMFWDDGTKTVTKTTPGDKFDPEIGIAMAVAKKYFGNRHKFEKVVADGLYGKYLDDYKKMFVDKWTKNLKNKNTEEKLYAYTQILNALIDVKNNIRKHIDEELKKHEVDKNEFKKKLDEYEEAIKAGKKPKRPVLNSHRTPEMRDLQVRLKAVKDLMTLIDQRIKKLEG